MQTFEREHREKVDKAESLMQVKSQVWRNVVTGEAVRDALRCLVEDPKISL